MVEKCEDFIVRNLDTANCLEVVLLANIYIINKTPHQVLLFSDQISSRKVKETALEFSSKHFQVVSLSFYTYPTESNLQALAHLPSLRILPVHLHREILKSDSLALYSQFGTLLTDELREDALERHLQRCGLWKMMIGLKLMLAGQV